jgi:hypothetical protein
VTSNTSAAPARLRTATALSGWLPLGSDPWSAARSAAQSTSSSTSDRQTMITTTTSTTMCQITCTRTRASYKLSRTLSSPSTDRCRWGMKTSNGVRVTSGSESIVEYGEEHAAEYTIDKSLHLGACSSGRANCPFKAVQPPIRCYSMRSYIPALSRFAVVSCSQAKRKDSQK